MIIKKIKTLATAVAFLASVSTAKALDTKPPEYKPLANLVGQGFEYVKTKEGNYVQCIHLHYDRNQDSGWGAEDFKGVDMIEYRLIFINKDGHPVLDKHPYILLVDDDSDGYADRMFIDNGKEKDGIFDEVEDLKIKKIDLDDFHGLGK